MSDAQSHPNKRDKPEYEVIHRDHRCNGPGLNASGQCQNIVTHWAQPKGYTGPIYCREHAYLANKRRA